MYTLLSLLSACSSVPVMPDASSTGVERADPATGSGEVYTVRVASPVGPITITFVDVDGTAMSGDMVLGATAELLAQAAIPTDPASPPPPNAIQGFAFSRWPDGVVPYVYQSGLDPASQAAFESAVARWETQGPLTFRPAEGTDEGWVEVTDDGTGCFSAVGYGTGARQLNLEPGACTTGNAMHEIGHVLGFFHEHARADRDNYVTYHPENLLDLTEDGTTEDEDAQFTTWVADGALGWDLGVYDVGSIMHYASEGFGSTAHCMDGGDTSGCVLLSVDGEYLSEVQRDHLSDTDIWASWRMYEDIWQLSSGGHERWTYVTHSTTTFEAAGVGDLNGDGWDEVVVPQADGLWVVNFASGANTLVTGSFKPTFVLVGDLDGDGRDDLMSQDGRRWVVKWKGLGRWQTLGSHREVLSPMRLADVDGDGRADVIRDRSGTWSWSSGGTGAWSRLAVGMPALADARVGELDGDHRLDVVAERGGELQVRRGATRAWEMVLPAGDIADTLLVDLSGDGVLDVAWADGGSLRWADVVTGVTSANPLDEAGAGMLTGDFDGDGTGDLLAAVAPFAWDGTAIVALRPDSGPTLEEAIAYADRYGGADIFLLDGTYTLPHRTCIPANTRIYGRDASAARIEGGDEDGLLCAFQVEGVRLESLTLADTSGEAIAALDTWESDVGVEGVTFEGGADTWGIFQHAGTVTLDDVRFTGMERGLVAEGGELIADRVVADHPTEVGLDLSRVSGQVTSTALLGGDLGVRVSDVAPAFGNVTFAEQGTYGLYAEQQNAAYWITLGLTNVAFDGAVQPMYGNFYWGYVTLDTVYYREGSWTWAGGWYSWVGDYVGVADPGVDAATGHLVKGSPLIDRGASSILSGADLDGDAWTADGDGDGVAAPDVGADEYRE